MDFSKRFDSKTETIQRIKSSKAYYSETHWISYFYPMKKVTGIGGVFFKCKEPNKMNEWYKTHLGIETTQWGANFEWRLEDNPEKKGSTAWNAFPETTKYFEPSTKEFMINYRVENLESLVEALKTQGVTILDEIASYDYGKFVHIMDMEGNKIELWEPVEE